MMARFPKCHQGDAAPLYLHQQHLDRHFGKGCPIRAERVEGTLTLWIGASRLGGMIPGGGLPQCARRSVALPQRSPRLCSTRCGGAV
jgi:hypothetical protein